MVKNTKKSSRKTVDTGTADELRTRYLLVFLFSLGVVVISLWLNPDPAGYGTHTQLGLPSCGFKEITGIPGPSCGYTTAFAHQAHGNIGLGFKTQPLGSLLFWGAVFLGVTSVLECSGRIRVLNRISSEVSGRHVFLLAVLAVLAWTFKLYIFAGVIP